ncbi:MAG TPA: hypothetical protein VD927_05445 [Chryseosolibacter sp.]|nr:hypothetical protein [Chryseosolibacter sp.]
MNLTMQMKLLVSLAQVDGKVADRERNYILNIGTANGISSDKVDKMIDEEHDMLIPEGLSPDEKFNYIYTLVQLMKIDERMYQEEIRFCSTIATKLGYDQEVLFDLMLHVKTTEMDEKEIVSLKALTQKHLIK